MAREDEILKKVEGVYRVSESNRRPYGPEGRALQAIFEGYDYVTGGWENAIADGHETKMPPFEQMRLEIYDYVIDDAEEHKFFGRDNIMAAIKIVFELRDEFDMEGEN